MWYQLKRVFIYIVVEIICILNLAGIMCDTSQLLFHGHVIESHEVFIWRFCYDKINGFHTFSCFWLHFWTTYKFKFQKTFKFFLTPIFVHLVMMIFFINVKVFRLFVYQSKFTFCFCTRLAYFSWRQWQLFVLWLLNSEIVMSSLLRFFLLN